LTPVPTPRKPNVIFDTTKTAVRHHTNIIEDLGYNFDHFMAENSDTTIGYNSEFRPLRQTETVFGEHPGFVFFRTIADLGMAYHFSDTIREVDRWTELERVLHRGNHNSAEADLPTASRLLNKDVTPGFSLPLSPSVVRHIPDAEVQPCGLAKQFGLQADGSRFAKSQLTQDLSFWTVGTNKSVNSRINLTRYPAMIYGWCLRRIIHFVVALRLAHPGQVILVAKIDFSDAYCRIFHAASAMVKSIIVAAGIAYLAL
jgi:hypothetical protein